MGYESQLVRIGFIMEETNHLEKAADHLQAGLDDLYAQAEKIVEAHWAAVRATEKKWPGWENKSVLRLRLRRKGNTIMLEWGKVRWAGSKARGTRTALVEYLRKTDDYGYNLKILKALSKDWEKPLVEDTETKLTAIRREWRHINKALQHIRFAKDARRAAMAADKNGGT